MNSTYSVHLPTRIHFGIGEFSRLGAAAKELGSKAFVMLDPFLKGSALEAKTLAQLESVKIASVLWHDIVPNPRSATCDRAAALALQEGCDVVIAIGGGSTIDAAKAVALVAANGGNAWDYTARANAEVRVPERRALPLLAIPTAAGTGAEVTPFAVLSNPDLKLKATIIHPFCFPDIALIDPSLHVTKPPRLTASTGVDTFLHAFEGYIGNRANSWTDIFSIRAIELVAENLPTACHEPGNLDARLRMAEACYLAGVTLGHIGVGIPHALGQAMGALKDTPHGESCAACVIPTVRWTLPHASDRLARVHDIFRPGSQRPEPDCASALGDALSDFFSSIGLGIGFGSLGLKRDEVDRLVEIAEINYGFDVACSSRPATTDDLKRIVLESL